MQICRIVSICDTLFVLKTMNSRPIYYIADQKFNNPIHNGIHAYAMLPKHFEGLPEKVIDVKRLLTNLPYKLYSPEELYPLLPEPYNNDLKALMELKKNIPPKYPKLLVVRNSIDKNIYIYNTQTITF